jgi:hypothetical protein
MNEIFVALIAGLLGGLVGFLAQVFLSVRSVEATSISDQISDLKRIEMYAIDYWLADPTNKAINKGLAAQLKGAVMASSTFEEDGPKVLGYRFSKYSDLISELDDIVTGGSFETEKKDVDPERVVATMRVVGKLIAHLRKCRRYVYLWR